MEGKARAKTAHGFQTTHWSLVLSAGDAASSERSQALNELCSIYWHPVYAFIRSCGRPPHEAEDLTQAFFAHLLEKNTLAVVDRERGKFRSFLRTAAKNFIRSEHRWRSARKRGGQCVFLSLDHAESRYADLAKHENDPEILFSRAWARSLMDQVLASLEKTYRVGGKEALFDHLQRHLWDDSDAIPYPEIATEMEMTVNAVKAAAFRIRAKFRERLQEEIDKTVDGPAEAESELTFLVSVFQS